MTVKSSEAPSITSQEVKVDQSAELSKLETIQERVTGLADKMPPHLNGAQDLRLVANELPQCIVAIDACVQTTIDEHNTRHRSTADRREKTFETFTAEAPEKAVANSLHIRTKIARHFGVSTGGIFDQEVASYASRRAETVSALLPKNFEKKVASSSYIEGDSSSHQLNESEVKEKVKEEFFQELEEKVGELERRVDSIYGNANLGKLAVARSKLFPPPTWARDYFYNINLNPIIRDLQQRVLDSRFYVERTSWYREEILPCVRNLRSYDSLATRTVREARDQLSEDKLFENIVSIMAQARSRNVNARPPSAETQIDPEKEVRGEFRKLANEVGEKKAIRRLAKQYHPDREGGDEEKFKVVSGLITERDEVKKGTSK